MSDIRVVRYQANQFDKWNKFIESSCNGTIFHRLDFLSYHKEKFIDNEHHLIWFKGETIFAVMPMAVFEQDGKKIAKSPYGASYGGIITREDSDYFDARDLIDSLISYLNSINVDEIVITPLIWTHNVSLNIEFNLLRSGFKVVNSDADSIILLSKCDLIENNLFSSSARRHLKKAKAHQITTNMNSANYGDFWHVMEKTFAKFETSPTHTLNDWQCLHQTFPSNIKMEIAYFDDKPIAAIGKLILNKSTDFAFYILQDPEFKDLQGLTFLFRESIKLSMQRKAIYYDLGTSSVNMYPRENIIRFKESLGGKTFLRNTYMKSISNKIS